MTDKIVSMEDYRQEKGWTIQGPARCAGCQHRWEAVVPAGTVSDLECPACERLVGFMEAGTLPEERWVCDCGCDIFRLSAEHIFCVSCGAPVEGWP